ncbi:phosphatase PAP2 family protein, partial [Arthrobacter sp. Hiyo1]|uniref:phosphatase PAP2 family protein n=1 Tax=Arthrobacter sp. Hiyo1 TaxID=1588020 RepID=UPI000A8BE6C5
MSAKGFGASAPELALDISLSHGRINVLVSLCQAINYGIGPVGAVLLVLVIGSYLAWVRGRPVQALAFCSVVAAGWLGSSAAKILVGRPRPPADAVGSLATPTGTSSFPSGHTAVALALVLAITIVLARTTTQRVAALTAGTLFVALVAFSRLRGTALVLLLGPPLERRMGSLKYAIAAVSTQILGVGIALGFLAAAQGLLGSWKAEMGGHLFMGPSAFIIGTAMAGTASMATLWRRRIRLAVSALLLLLALYSGGFADLV